MSERKYPVITISREFGAGGHSIARVVSERLGIPYYDRDFAKQAAARSGYSQEDIDREGENLSRSARLLDNILNNSAGYFSSHDAIYQAQKELPSVRSRTGLYYHRPLFQSYPAKCRYSQSGYFPSCRCESPHRTYSEIRLKRKGRSQEISHQNGQPA